MCNPRATAYRMRGYRRRASYTSMSDCTFTSVNSGHVPCPTSTWIVVTPAARPAARSK